MPCAGRRKPQSDHRLSPHVPLPVFPRALVDEVTAEVGRTEKRNRTSPALVMADFAIGSALSPDAPKVDRLSRLINVLACGLVQGRQLPPTVEV